MSVTLNKTTLVLGIGQTGKLTATVDPVGATVKWSSDNGKVALSDKSGNVYAYKKGNAKIIAEEGSNKAICDVEVFDVEVRKLGFYDKLAVNQAFDIVLVPSSGDVVTELEDTSDEGTLTLVVSEDGREAKVTCLKKGNGVIHLTATYKTVVYELDIEFEIVDEFVPITELTAELVASLILHDNARSVLAASKGRSVKLIQAADGLPDLYYIKTNTNPLVFEYELHAVSDDISKNMLTSIVGGLAGTQGPQGTAGADGAQGPQGPQGPQGDQGPQGA